jgi:hypothetical protein
MDNRICDMIRDMMPLYIDGVCSQYSRQMVENHIKGCPECRHIWESYRDPALTEDIKASNENEFRKLAMKIKKKNRLKTLLIILGALAASFVGFMVLGLTVLGILSIGGERYATIDTSNYGIYEGHIEAERQDLFSGLFIFPERISENASDVYYFYSCESGGFDNSYQQFLKCTYAEEEYNAEIERLKGIKCVIPLKDGPVVNTVEFSDTKFGLPAYITAYASHGMYEYALCNDADKTIVYVYLQLIGNDRVVFSKEYLPLEFQDGKSLLEDTSFGNTNIYYAYQGNGIYMNYKN